MDQELMTAAICWEIGANVSVEFAHREKGLFYFCPEDDCLAEVRPEKRTNFFFKARGSHAPGCANEKKKTTESTVPTAPIARKAAIPPQAIPTHLGHLAKARKNTRPSLEQMRALAVQSRLAPPLLPGTFKEVVDAWCALHGKNRRTYPLYIGSQPLTYADAFSPFSQEDKEKALSTDRKIVYGQATVKEHNHSFYVATKSKFKIGESSLPITIRIRSRDAHHAHLKAGQDVVLFLHGAIPAPNTGKSYIELYPADAYSGVVIKRSDFSSLTA